MQKCRESHDSLRQCLSDWILSSEFSCDWILSSEFSCDPRQKLDRSAMYKSNSRNPHLRNSFQSKSSFSLLCTLVYYL